MNILNAVVFSALLFMIPSGFDAEAFQIDHVQAYKTEIIKGAL